MINSKKTGVYKITNLKNNKIYIGSSTSTKDGFKDRIKTHIRLLDRGEHYNKHLQSAWVKYGSQMFKFEILEELTGKLKILEREQYYIDVLDATNPKIGYNKAKIAGSILGYKHTEASKLKMSESAKLHSKAISERMKIYCKNRIISETTKKKISERLTGIKRNNSFKEKMRIIQTGRNHSDESKNKMSKAKIGLPSKKRLKVYQLDLDDNIIKLWGYAGEAERELNIRTGAISAVCKKNRKTAGGFKWVYEKDKN
jgi:group I intron endonuclease